MKNIEITHTTTPLPPHLSGPALRSAQSADRQVEAVVSRIRQAAARLEVVLNETQVSAALLAEGFAAVSEYRSALDARSTLTARHRVDVVDDRIWPIMPNLHWAPWFALNQAAEYYRKTLVGAGIPMEESGYTTAQYWQDAAARGC